MITEVRMWWLVAVANGDPGELTPSFGPRTVKVDLFGFAPGKHRWGTDWKVSTMEQWSAVVACAPDGARVEKCRFVDGVWWGVVVDGETRQTLVKLPAPGEIVLGWTPRGRLSSWDVTGDRGAFWTAASNAVLKHTFHRPDMALKPDGQREVGQDLEQILVRWIAASLEWELPKNGDPDGGWKCSQAPLNGRRWTQSTSSPDVSLQVTASDASGVTIGLTGTVAEQVAETSVLDLSIQTELLGTATFDRQTGTITRAKLETAVRSTSGTLDGHTRYISVVAPWTEGEPTTPGDMPQPAL